MPGCKPCRSSSIKAYPIRGYQVNLRNGKWVRQPIPRFLKWLTLFLTFHISCEGRHTSACMNSNSIDWIIYLHPAETRNMLHIKVAELCRWWIFIHTLTVFLKLLCKTSHWLRQQGKRCKGQIHRTHNRRTPCLRDPRSQFHPTSKTWELKR